MKQTAKTDFLTKYSCRFYYNDLKCLIKMHLLEKQNDLRQSLVCEKT